MEIIVISNNLEFINALKKWDDQSADISLEIDEPCEIPGMFETWFEIAVTVGIFTIPVSIGANLLSSWMWSKLNHPNQNGIKGQIIIRNGEKEIQADLSNIDNNSLKEIFIEAIDNVNSRK